MVWLLVAPLIHWDSNLADQTSLSTSAMSVQLSPITVSNDNAVDSLLPGEGEWVGVFLFCVKKCVTSPS